MAGLSKPADFAGVTEDLTEFRAVRCTTTTLTPLRMRRAAHYREHTPVLTVDCYMVYKHIKGVGDFNGDGYADILWQNDNGQVAIWEMKGFDVIGTAIVFNPGTSWLPVGTADFDAKANSDILWRNVSGQIVIWEMNGFNISASASLGNPGQSWHPIGN